MEGARRSVCGVWCEVRGACGVCACVRVVCVRGVRCVCGVCVWVRGGSG